MSKLSNPDSLAHFADSGEVVTRSKISAKTQQFCSKKGLDKTTQSMVSYASKKFVLISTF